MSSLVETVQNLFAFSRSSETKDVEPKTLTDLPPEMIFHIFKLLDHNSLIKASAANSILHKVGIITWTFNAKKLGIEDNSNMKICIRYVCSVARGVEYLISKTNDVIPKTALVLQKNRTLFFSQVPKYFETMLNLENCSSKDLVTMLSKRETYTNNNVLNYILCLLERKLKTTPFQSVGLATKALLTAVDNKSVSAASLLIRCGGNVNAKFYHCKKYDDVPLINWAIRKGFLPIIKLLIKNDADTSNLEVHSQNALHNGAKKGVEEILKELLTGKNSKEALEMRDSEGMTPLLHASKWGPLSCLELLHKFGASLTARDTNGNLPIHLAASEGPFKNLKYIVTHDRENLDAQGFGNRTPLHCAVIAKDIKKTTYLLDSNADLEAQTTNNETPLLLAAKINAEEIFNLLIERGASVKQKNVDGMTALHYAGENGNSEMAKTLNQRGALLSIEDSQEVTPIGRAKLEGHTDFIDTLKALGAPK